METAEKIKDAYIEFLLENHNPPGSAYQIAKKAGISEEEFFNTFTSLKAIDQAVWGDFFTETQNRVESEEVYADYTVREKLLAFYFTMIEVLKSRRSYVLKVFPSELKEFSKAPQMLSEFKSGFMHYVDNLILEGRESQELSERPSFIIDIYPRIIWAQALLIIRFWVRDDSMGFEKTDAYIEKAVNFGIDVMGPTSIDSAFDFFKYAFQNR